MKKSLKTHLNKRFLLLSYSMLVLIFLFTCIYTFVEARREYNNTVSDILGTIKKVILPSLIASDYFEVQQIVEATDIDKKFYRFDIVDMQGNQVASFKKNSKTILLHLSQSGYLPIADQDGTVWGWVKYTDNLNYLIPVLTFNLLLFFLFILLAVVVAQFSQKSISFAMSEFNSLLEALKLVVNNLSVERDAINSMSLNLEFTEYHLMNDYVEKLISEIVVAKNKLKLVTVQEERHKHAEQLFTLSARVAHDIRSPLAAMEVIVQASSNNMSPERYKVLSSAIQGIRDISNNLLKRYYNNEITSQNENNKTICDDGNRPRYILLDTIVEQIISQKRHEWQAHPCKLMYHCEEAAKCSWVMLSPNELKRTLSNLLNNAYEALRDNGVIQIKIELKEKLFLSIQDNGTGIPADKIADVLQGASTKHKGDGIGLISAKQYLNSFGGQLCLESNLNQGTQVLLALPNINAPEWFPKAISC